MPTPERKEIATTLDGRDITRGLVSPLMLELPDDTVLQQRGGGDYSLYREVLRDDHVKAALTQRIQSVIARPWEVRPGGSRAIDKAAADHLEDQLRGLRWDDITTKMLYGVFYGHAVGEVMWGTDGRRITLADIRVRDRRRFGYDGAHRLRLKTLANPLGELVPGRKFWQFCTGADHDDAPYGLGLAHWLYWPVWLKRNGIRFWAVALEKYGSPTTVGSYPAGTSEDDQNRLLAALQSIQRDAAMIFPEGIQVDLLSATKGNSSADNSDFVAHMNAAILVITVGQTASTHGTPGKLGNDKEQGQVRADITRADADLVCMSFNDQVARWLTEFNFPGAQVPQVWRVMDEPEDINIQAERDERLSRVGYRPGLARVIQVYGEGYETMPASNSDLSTQDMAPGFAEPADGPDTPDAQASRLATDAAPEVARLIDQVGRLAQSAPDADAMQSALLAAYGHLDTQELTRIMALGFAAAELAGMFEAAQANG